MADMITFPLNHQYLERSHTMSTSLLYHALGLVGYQYLKTKFETVK